MRELTYEEIEAIGGGLPSAGEVGAHALAGAIAGGLAGARTGTVFGVVGGAVFGAALGASYVLIRHAMQQEAVFWGDDRMPTKDGRHFLLRGPHELPQNWFSRAIWGVAWWGVPFFLLVQVVIPMAKGYVPTPSSTDVLLAVFGGALFGLVLSALTARRKDRSP